MKCPPAKQPTNLFAIAVEALAAYYDQASATPGEAGPRPVRWADLADPQNVPIAFEVRSFRLYDFSAELVGR